jgi:anti-sigma B factor antagonist
VTAVGEGVPPVDLRTETDGASVVLWMRGDLDMAAEAAMTAAFARIFAEPVREVVVDLSEVDFLDSTGIRVLLLGRDRAQRSDAVLTVRHPRPLVESVLRISGLAHCFGLPPSDR